MSKAQTSTYVAKFPVRLDGTTYQPGERLALTDDQAASLLVQKIVAPAPDEAPAAAEGQAAKNPTAKTQGSKA